MIMSEEDAAKKRCTPAIPVLLLDPEVRNGLGAGGLQVGLNCIGSKCAQWSWFDYVDAKGQTYRGNGDSFTKGRASRTPGDVKQGPGRGYCGLTGSK